jgi:hypothetical protein
LAKDLVGKVATIGKLDDLGPAGRAGGDDLCGDLDVTVVKDGHEAQFNDLVQDI